MKGIISIKYVCLIAIAGFLMAAVAVIYSQQKKIENAADTMSCPMMKNHADKDTAHKDCPMMKQEKSAVSESKTDSMSNHSDHHKMMMQNGEKTMGFSQTATTHHFLITDHGGFIQVEANDSNDKENINKIKSHLTEIANHFQNGNFSAPFAVHSQMPPGVEQMTNLKNEIIYSYEEMKNGARVKISTQNPQALSAIHAFLKFQIEDHQTGDKTN